MNKNNLLKIISLSVGLALSTPVNSTEFSNCHVITYDHKNRMIPICAQLTLDNLPSTLKAGETYLIRWNQLNVNQITLGYSLGVGQLDWILLNQKIDKNTDKGQISFQVPKNFNGRKIRFDFTAYKVNIGSVHEISKREFKIE